ncbi:MAG: inositol monophosphatase family protein [Thermodesulfobacteriota bacterium]
MERIISCAAGCPDRDLAEALRLAAHAALAGGAVLRLLYGQPHQITHKGAIDLVTEADVASEQAVLEVLRQGPAGTAILAEESSASFSGPPSGPVWIIDPLDGTTNFAHGFPFFCVSVALARGDQCQVGVIYAPMQDELFCACRGAGAWLNGQPIRVSGVATLEQSLLATGFPYAIAEEVEGVVAALRCFLTTAQGIRRAGAAALDLAYLACGRVDGFWEINLKPWDTAAGQVLVEEAGGRLSGMHGGDYTPFLPELVASNGLLHREMVGRLAPFSRLGGGMG